MFGDVQHTIRDAQYRDALTRLHASPPEATLPSPKEEQLQKFMDSNQFSLDDILESPIGAFFFKDYLSSYLNVTILADFLIQYRRVEKLDAPEKFELEELIYLAEELPAQYKAMVRRIQQELKLRQREELEEEGEYEGTEAEDLVIDDEADPLLVSKHFPDDDDDFEKNINSNQQPTLSRQKKIPMHPNNVLATLRFGEHHSIDKDDPHRMIAFGGTSAPPPRMGEMNVNSRRQMKRNVGIVSAVDFVTEERKKADQEVNEEEDDANSQDLRDLERMEEDRNAKIAILDLFTELGTLVEKKAFDLFTSFRESVAFRNMASVMWAAELPLTPADFRRFRILGKGAFGSVSSVKHKATGQLTAMKMMNKKLVKGKKAWPLVNAEKEVLQILGDNPSSFTIWLKYAFQDDEYFYMAIPLCTGGDLAYHLQESTTFSVERVRFYAAEIFEGIAHLHKLGIIYRDLKPENVILDNDGHCRISDMGLAAITHGTRIKSKAGTPGYWAPEVLVKLFYSYPVDYWSLGVVMFEFLIGMCPFSRSYTGMDRDKAVRYWPIKYPSHLTVPNSKDLVEFPEECKQLLKGLLKRRASKRFQEQDVRNHPFFRGINWEMLRQRLVQPPFLPSGEKINAGASRQLEDLSNERMFRHIKLAPEDHISDFDYISKCAHEIDIANVLTLQKENEEMIPRSRSRMRAKSRKASSVTMLGNIKNTISTRKPGECILM